MANVIARWFTPSDSDRSGMVGDRNSTARNVQKKKEAERTGVAKARTQTKYAGAALGAQYKKDEADTAKKMLLGQ